MIYIGAVFPATVKGAFAQVFSEKERKERGDALGHVLAVNDYEPGAEYIYYWGSGWSKYGFEADTDWNKYLEEYARKIRNPLAVAIKIIHIQEGMRIRHEKKQGIWLYQSNTLNS